jgi:hypothetical protein
MDEETKNPDTTEMEPIEPVAIEPEVDQPIVTSVEAETTPEITKTKHRFKLTKKEVMAACLIFVAFVIGAGGTYALTGVLDNGKKENQTNAGTTPTPTPTPTEVLKPVSDKISWLATPTKLADQGIFNDPRSYYQDTTGETIKDIAYYLVGSFDKSGDQLMIVEYPTMFKGRMLAKKSGQTFTVYKQHSPDSFYQSQENGQVEYQGPPLNAGVTIDNTTVISEIASPDTFSYSNLNLQKVSYHFSSMEFITTTAPVSTQYLTYTKLGEAEDGVIYEASREEETFKVINYRLLLKDHEMYTYSMSDNLLTAGTPSIIWSNDQYNGDKYKSAVAGCGTANSIEVAKNISDSDLEVIGRSALNNQQVYGFKSTSNALFKKHFDEYTQFYSYDNLVTADQFKSDHGVYLAKDGMGRWIVLEKEKYVPAGGCAKPVVYIYPSVPTFVNVAVDADVTLSDPEYPQLGWRNVLALPNGQLIYNQQGYNSLFWEGYGHGYYPEITTGKFVKKADAEKQIKTDLYAQGLNNKEVKDFMEFWTPKIPNSPYIRLTWLDTQQMENLAKLSVYPRPQTLIRVFLDMQGVQEPYSLPTQKLQAVPRNGFTVVEWGGLARDGSVPKPN